MQPPASTIIDSRANRARKGAWAVYAPLWVGGLIGATTYFGARYLANTLTHESTDDAFIEGHVVSIAPRVAGQVLAVHVVDNQAVRRGELLVEVDPRDFEARVRQKRAAQQASVENLHTVTASFDLLQARVQTAATSAQQAEAQAQADAANARVAKLNLDRSQELFTARIISAQDFDNAKATNDAAVATWQASRENVAVQASKLSEAKIQVTVARAYVEAAEAQTRQSEAEAESAELDLSYTKIAAPSDGRVTRRAVEPGGYVQVGQALMALVPTNLYVIANYKETQLTDLRPGQPTTVRIESYPDRVFRAHVESIQAGSGARFSLLPPENAVGNYVKVVQRVPVKIVFDEPLPPDRVVGPGMSVWPEVAVAAWRASGWLVGGLAVLAAGLACAVTRALLRRGAPKAPAQATR